MSKVYVSPAVLGACYGFKFIPIDHDTFKKSPSERKGLKRIKKSTNKPGKMKTIIRHSCND